MGSRIKHYRRTRSAGRLSAAKLAEATGELGHRVEASVIANMETGRRSNVTLAELIVLAAALHVTPAQLVVPLDEDEDFPRLPDHTTDPWTFYKWFTAAGVGTLPGPESPEYVLALDAYRRHDGAVGRYLAMRDKPEQDANAYLDSLINVRAEIRSRGWRLPPLNDRAGQQAHELGVTNHLSLDVAVAEREQELAP